MHDSGWVWVCRTCGYPLTEEQKERGLCAKCDLVRSLLVERYSPSPRKGPKSGPPECSQGADS